MSTNQKNKSELVFGESEASEARWLVGRALAEDLPTGDPTSETLFGDGAEEVDGLAPGCRARVRCVARAEGVVAGTPLISLVYEQVDPAVTVDIKAADGSCVQDGTVIAEIEGPVGVLLRGERTALNFLQRLSGIATSAAEWLEHLSGCTALLVDTRKTTPGWRELEKYAVRAGGASNHRRNLSDGILIKDNHVQILRSLGKWEIQKVVTLFRRRFPGLFLQVEVDNRLEFLDALQEDVDSILLDNFSLDDLRWAVAKAAELGEKRPTLEASGGIRKEDVRAVAETGVDRISVGALTHSAPSLDIGLDFVSVEPERE